MGRSSLREFSIINMLACRVYGAYFETRVKLVRPPFVILENNEKLSNLKHGFVHRTCHRESQIGLSKASMAHPFK